MTRVLQGFLLRRAGGLLILMALLMGCSPSPTVEQRIIAAIRDMEARVEAAERRPFMRHVAADFSGQGGQMNRDQLNAFVLLQLRVHQRLEARLLPIHVSASEAGRAQARFRALVTGGPGWLPDRGQLFEIATQWRLQDDDWLLVGADWQPVNLEDVLD